MEALKSLYIANFGTINSIEVDFCSTLPNVVSAPQQVVQDIIKALNILSGLHFPLKYSDNSMLRIETLQHSFSALRNKHGWTYFIDTDEFQLEVYRAALKELKVCFNCPATKKNLTSWLNDVFLHESTMHINETASVIELEEKNLQSIKQNLAYIEQHKTVQDLSQMKRKEKHLSEEYTKFLAENELTDAEVAAFKTGGLSFEDEKKLVTQIDKHVISLRNAEETLAQLHADEMNVHDIDAYSAVIMSLRPSDETYAMDSAEFQVAAYLNAKKERQISSVRNKYKKTISDYNELTSRTCHLKEDQQQWVSTIRAALGNEGFLISEVVRVNNARYITPISSILGKLLDTTVLTPFEAVIPILRQKEALCDLTVLSPINFTDEYSGNIWYAIECEEWVKKCLVYTLNGWSIEDDELPQREAVKTVSLTGSMRVGVFKSRSESSNSVLRINTEFFDADNARIDEKTMKKLNRLEKKQKKLQKRINTLADQISLHTAEMQRYMNSSMTSVERHIARGTSGTDNHITRVHDDVAVRLLRNMMARKLVSKAAIVLSQIKHEFECIEEATHKLVMVQKQLDFPDVLERRNELLSIRSTISMFLSPIAHQEMDESGNESEETQEVDMREMLSARINQSMESLNGLYDEHMAIVEYQKCQIVSCISKLVQLTPFNYTMPIEYRDITQWSVRVSQRNGRALTKNQQTQLAYFAAQVCKDRYTIYQIANRNHTFAVDSHHQSIIFASAKTSAIPKTCHFIGIYYVNECDTNVIVTKITD
ncbi:hypothetical protein PCE1_003674 [Barthelona sp. PCE]